MLVHRLRKSRVAAPTPVRWLGPLVVSLVALLWAVPVTAQQPISPPVKSAFPITFPNQGQAISSHPVIADLGLTPGYRSIVFGLRNGKLYVLRRLSADVWVPAAGFPVTLPAHIASSPAVGDIDGDGDPEIVVGYGSTLTLDQPGGARAYEADGTLIWEVVTGDTVGAPNPGGPNGVPDPVFSTPAIADVDGDGRVEVAFSSLDEYVYLVDGATGANEPNWPRWLRDTSFSSPALHDIDGDGTLEVIVGVASHVEGPPVNASDGGCLHVLRNDATNLPGFPQCVDQTIVSSPAVGDIDGDGRPEIVHGTGRFFQGVSRRVYAWNCDGTVVDGWPVTVDGQVETSPALGDLTGDGVPEVIFTDDNSGSSGTFHLYAYRGDGSELFSLVPVPFSGVTNSAKDPVVADVLGDTEPEILVPVNSEVVVVSADGVQLTEDGPDYSNQKISLYTETALAAVAVGDLEIGGSDDRIEVLAISATPFPDATDTKVYVWNPVERTSVPPWGDFGQSPQRRAVHPLTPSCAPDSCATDPAALDFFPVTPCRVVDTRFGQAPQLSAGQSRTFAVAGNCGVPLTAVAVSLNATAAQASKAGHISLTPAGCSANTSTVNFRAGRNRANNTILPLSDAGDLSAIAVFPGAGTVHLILDVNGYYE